MRYAYSLLAGIAVLAGAALPVAAQQKTRRPAEKPDRPDVGRMLERFDKNGDGFLDRSECPPPLQTRFDRLDRDKDGKLSNQELQGVARGRRNQPRGTAAGRADRLFHLLDADRDGNLSKEELQNGVRLLEKFDKNKDGLIEPQELPSPGSRGGRPGEVNTPPARGERHEDRLEVGDPAPDFTLPEANGTAQVTLSSFHGKKPVVLVFASCT